MANKDTLLKEVVVMRPILFFLLVVYHCFIIYSGGWHMPDGAYPNESYAWISKFSYSFLLESFVFISGYVFAYQLSVRSQCASWKYILINKSKRLLLPMVIWGCVYFGVFYPDSVNFLLVYKILEGASHLWYLPMLFWTFVICLLLIKYVYKIKYRFILLCLLCIVSYVPLPFRFNNAMYYALFFYLGYEMYIRREVVASIITRKQIIGTWLVYVLMFVSLIICREKLIEVVSSSEYVLYKIFGYSLTTMMRVTYAVFGLLALYITSLSVVAIYNIVIPKWLVKFGDISMGAYIIHQFVIMCLYFRTNLPAMLENKLPWVVLILTIVLSLFFAYVLKRTPIIKKCI